MKKGLRLSAGARGEGGVLNGPRPYEEGIKTPDSSRIWISLYERTQTL